ncbi:DoxX family protein [Amycolatopsis sp. NPDC059021]|uniref:DoxX family protein n=1 Tax=Amycolatopsis sp. NPDC059021 TaxID=3346704 RepID=UPI00366C56CA
MLDLGLALLRVPAGLLLMGHGAQKLFGWFGGDGPEGSGKGLESLGYRHGKAMAILAGLVEIAAGAGLALGLLTPLAAAATIGTMVNAAVSAHGSNGLWAQNGGYEYPLVIGTLAAGLAMHGPGKVSIDGLFGFAETGFWWGIGAIVLGVLAAAGALGGRRKPA